MIRQGDKRQPYGRRVNDRIDTPSAMSDESKPPFAGMPPFQPDLPADAQPKPGDPWLVTGQHDAQLDGIWHLSEGPWTREPTCGEAHPVTGEPCALSADHATRASTVSATPLYMLQVYNAPPDPFQRALAEADAEIIASLTRTPTDMGASPERQAGAVAAAHALSWGSTVEAARADATAMSLDATTVLGPYLRIDRDDVTPQHLAGAADFFHALAHALHGVAAGMQAPARDPHGRRSEHLPVPPMQDMQCPAPDGTPAAMHAMVQDVGDSGCVPCPACSAREHEDCIGKIVHQERTLAAVRHAEALARGAARGQR